jgi:hypothetical protein
MTTLRAGDFKNAFGLDMWGALVEDAILRGLLPKDTKADDVEDITVEITGATL